MPETTDTQTNAGDTEARVLKEALRSIIVRCREGDSRSDWLPTIARIAEEALGENDPHEPLPKADSRKDTGQ